MKLLKFNTPDGFAFVDLDNVCGIGVGSENNIVRFTLPSGESSDFTLADKQEKARLLRQLDQSVITPTFDAKTGIVLEED